MRKIVVSKTKIMRSLTLVGAIGNDLKIWKMSLRVLRKPSSPVVGELSSVMMMIRPS